jgi:hypothetical protein
VGASFTSGQTCTADVTFTPKFAGLRNGGIVALDESGTLQAQSYVHGTGTGPQMIFFRRAILLRRPGSRDELSVKRHAGRQWL